MDKDMNSIYQRFQIVKGKRILIYGIGIIAERLVESLSGFCIVGIIDRICSWGDIKGIPIRTWDDVYEGDADIVIIASLPKNYSIIYDRIIDRCIAYDMKIYGSNGVNLIPYYGIRFTNIENNKFYEKNEKELANKIIRYEAVSFDLFDTLIMRKNLEPTDLFNIVEEKIKKKGIFIPNYKRYRREAELQSKGGDIYRIYKIFQQMLNLDKQTVITIMNEEIQCEKDSIIPRKKMTDLMLLAHNMGKKVNIITNMYLPKNILDDILIGKRIRGYDDIFVSCEYGVAKGNGLFEEYLQKVKAQNYLHIGDDEWEDILSARKYGLDVYGIKSAYEMLKISNYRGLLMDVRTINEKGLIGLLISELFNDPFALYNTNGFVRVSEIKMLSKIFVGPIVLLYILKLVETVNKFEECDGILFGARDGFLFYNIYKKIYCNGFLKIPQIPFYYFMCSRKLCLRAGMTRDENIRFLKRYVVDSKVQEVLTRILGILKVFPYDEEMYLDLDDYYMGNKNEIMKKSEETRKAYCKYLNKKGINKEGHYLFCDLISQGTSQYGLNQVFEGNISGFYLCKTPGEYKINVYSCYQYDESDFILNNIKYTNLLESIITSLESSVEDMDEDGNPIFSKETRTLQELKDVQIMQEGIEEFVLEYIRNLYVEKIGINEKLPKDLLKKLEEVYLTEESINIKNKKHFEDLHEKYHNIFECN